MKYRIWSIEHNMWWKPFENGYAGHIKDAGIYEADKAIEIVRSANAHRFGYEAPNEALVPVENDDSAGLG